MVRSETYILGCDFILHLPLIMLSTTGYELFQQSIVTVNLVILIGYKQLTLYVLRSKCRDLEEKNSGWQAAITRNLDSQLTK